MNLLVFSLNTEAFDMLGLLIKHYYYYVSIYVFNGFSIWIWANFLLDYLHGVYYYYKVFLYDFISIGWVGNAYGVWYTIFCTFYGGDG